MSLKTLFMATAMMVGTLTFCDRANAQITANAAGVVGTSYYTPSSTAVYYSSPAYYTTPYMSSYYSVPYTYTTPYVYGSYYPSYSYGGYYPAPVYGSYYEPYYGAGLIVGPRRWWWR
jgi:hypothetical protein